ncbi:hypothetical protein GOBAR_DD28730 [Gossypium barbadense]|nr:hypothetical protein GOBAR_DD28730 [Gossypium barbadense]
MKYLKENENEETEEDEQTRTCTKLLVLVCLLLLGYSGINKPTEGGSVEVLTVEVDRYWKTVDFGNGILGEAQHKG